ncbi:MAG: POT family proton-dependent oligopeptide transporter [Chitinophagales bacterium]|jgi:POT family proton-dependent oligopeptide transporter
MAGLNNSFPKGIPYIIGNEAAERYSFYGMKAIFVVFLTKFISNAAGELAVFDETDAKFWLHIFIFSTYGLSLAGAFLADVYLGKYKTIISLSIVYCIGHFILALFETKMGFLFGCSLIAIGAGGIKPCVSAHVGDQFDESNSHLLDKMYNWFYFSINAGAVVAYLIAEPLLRNDFLISKGLNSAVAFGLPGVLMVIATFVFWLGRKKFVHVPPAGWSFYAQELFSKKGLKLILKLSPIYIFLAVFWSLFDQTAGAWVLQAQSDLMIKTINLGFTSITVYPSQLGVMNALFIVLFIPIFAYFVYPQLAKIMKLTYVNKMALGMFLAALSFALISWVQSQMDQGVAMNISWQILAYVILTAAEIFVSISSLEFSYTQAPKALKSLVLSFWLIAVAMGNLFTALVNLAIKRPDGTILLDGAAYFWFFTGLMFVAAIIFYFMNRNYIEEHHIQNVPSGLH